MVTFATFTPNEQEIVTAIAVRSVLLLIHEDELSACMDISATHAHTELRLGELLVADDSNFIHDLAGIRRHLDRTTGHLTGFFVPRYAK